MLRRAAAAALLVPVLFLAACSSGTSAVTDVDAQKAKEIVAQEDVKVIDVRTPAEYASGHLEGAVNIDVNSPAFESSVSALPKDATYFVYCRSGNRSGVATDQMAELGFTTLYDLQGGIQDWAAAGGQVVA